MIENSIPAFDSSVGDKEDTDVSKTRISRPNFSLAAASFA